LATALGPLELLALARKLIESPIKQDLAWPQAGLSVVGQ